MAENIEDPKDISLKFCGFTRLSDLFWELTYEKSIKTLVL